MTSYDFITHPNSKKKVKLNSKSGQNIIQNYINYINSLFRQEGGSAGKEELRGPSLDAAAKKAGGKKQQIAALRASIAAKTTELDKLQRTAATVARSAATAERMMREAERVAATNKGLATKLDESHAVLTDAMKTTADLKKTRESLGAKLTKALGEAAKRKVAQEKRKAEKIVKCEICGVVDKNYQNSFRLNNGPSGERRGCCFDCIVTKILTKYPTAEGFDGLINRVEINQYLSPGVRLEDDRVVEGKLRELNKIVAEQETKLSAAEKTLKEHIDSPVLPSSNPVWAKADGANARKWVRESYVAAEKVRDEAKERRVAEGRGVATAVETARVEVRAEAAAAAARHRHSVKEYKKVDAILKDRVERFTNRQVGNIQRRDAFLADAMAAAEDETAKEKARKEKVFIDLTAPNFIKYLSPALRRMIMAWTELIKDEHSRDLIKKRAAYAAIQEQMEEMKREMDEVLEGRKSTLEHKIHQESMKAKQEDIEMKQQIIVTTLKQWGKDDEKAQDFIDKIFRAIIPRCPYCGDESLRVLVSGCANIMCGNGACTTNLAGRAGEAAPHAGALAWGKSHYCGWCLRDHREWEQDEGSTRDEEPPNISRITHQHTYHCLYRPNRAGYYAAHADGTVDLVGTPLAVQKTHALRAVSIMKAEINDGNSAWKKLSPINKGKVFEYFDKMTEYNSLRPDQKVAYELRRHFSRPLSTQKSFSAGKRAADLGWVMADGVLKHFLQGILPHFDAATKAAARDALRARDREISEKKAELKHAEAQLVGEKRAGPPRQIRRVDRVVDLPPGLIPPPPDDDEKGGNLTLVDMEEKLTTNTIRIHEIEQIAQPSADLQKERKNLVNECVILSAKIKSMEGVSDKRSPLVKKIEAVQAEIELLDPGTASKRKGELTAELDRLLGMLPHDDDRKRRGSGEIPTINEMLGELTAIELQINELLQDHGGHEEEMVDLHDRHDVLTGMIKSRGGDVVKQIEAVQAEIDHLGPAGAANAVRLDELTAQRARLLSMLPHDDDRKRRGSGEIPTINEMLGELTAIELQINELLQDHGGHEEEMVDLHDRHDVLTGMIKSRGGDVVKQIEAVQAEIDHLGPAGAANAVRLDELTAQRARLLSMLPHDDDRKRHGRPRARRHKPPVAFPTGTLPRRRHHEPRRAPTLTERQPQAEIIRLITGHLRINMTDDDKMGPKAAIIFSSALNLYRGSGNDLAEATWEKFYMEARFNWAEHVARRVLMGDERDEILAALASRSILDGRAALEYVQTNRAVGAESEWSNMDVNGNIR